MTRKPPHQPLARVLEMDADLARWTARYREEVALTSLVRSHLPRALGERVRVSDARNQVLELAAGAGAIAAALRQRAPELRAALAHDGHPFAEIRVRVDVAGSTVASPAAQRPPWDSRAAAPLFDLADRLPAGPLQHAIRRWSRRARGR
ncbi:MAG TPA: DciA family protein [Casimicrobiaceae bacterium]|nr:DciA family protein [Casimicrobiaceae bacterium]